jgi:PAS domain S-box-containing protein
MDNPALLQAVLETSDDAIVACAADGRVVTWSPTAERLFGRGAGEMVGRPFEALFAEHLKADVQTVVARVLAGERIRHFETEVQRPDGMPLPFSLSLCPLGDEGGQAAVLVVARDVTEQRLAQAALAEVEARLEEGEAMAHVGSWLWDVRTGAVQWSAEFHRIHRVDPRDFAGTIESHLAFVHPADRSRVTAALEASVATGRPFVEEYRIVRGDGVVGAVKVRAQPAISSSGAAVGLRGIGQDVGHAP